MTEIRDAAPTVEQAGGMLASVGAVASGAGAMTKLAVTSTFRLLGDKLFPTPLRGRNGS